MSCLNSLPLATVRSPHNVPRTPVRVPPVGRVAVRPGREQVAQQATRSGRRAGRISGGSSTMDSVIGRPPQWTRLRRPWDAGPTPDSRRRRPFRLPPRSRRYLVGPSFLGSSLGVELQQPREHLVADLIWPAIAVRLLLRAPIFFVDFVVEQELAVDRGCRASRRRRGPSGPWQRTGCGACRSRESSHADHGIDCRSWSGLRRSGPSDWHETCNNPRRRPPGLYRFPMRQGTETSRSSRKGYTEGRPSLSIRRTGSRLRGCGTEEYRMPNSLLPKDDQPVSKHHIPWKKGKRRVLAKTRDRKNPLQIGGGGV